MIVGSGGAMQFHAIVWPDGGQYAVVFVDAPGCQTCASTPAKAEAMARDAVEGWVEVHLVTGSALPPKPQRIRRRLPKGGWWLTITIPLKIAVRAALVTTRVRMGLSQADLATRMKVTRQAYQQLESPDANLRLDTLTRAFDALGVVPLITLAPQPAISRRARGGNKLRALVRGTPKSGARRELDWGKPAGREVW
jgi:transcriptional regulator with XRE-family HTH domain/predicted RNase H-like HicB family nuclease